jgi:trehalose 6-phosphate phosphatase
VATKVLRLSELSSDPRLKNALSTIEDSASSSGLFFDFDGVLSNIQADPESVQPLPGIASALASLSKKFKRVTVLSSRPATFLYERFRSIENLRILGLYGIESADQYGNIKVAPRAEPWLDIIPQALDAARSELPKSVYIEDKRLSIGLHYRADPTVRTGIESWARNASAKWGFKVQDGRMAVELKPDLSIDKGTTLANELPEFTTALYCGDDLGDLAAFRALRLHQDHSRGFTGFSIGVGNDTIVDEVFKESDIFVESPEALRTILEELAS